MKEDIPEDVAVSPVRELASPVSSTSETPNIEDVIVFPESVFQSPDATHVADELSEAVMVPPAMTLWSPASESSIYASLEEVTVRPPMELLDPLM